MSERWQDLLLRDHETTEKVFAAMEKPFTSPAGPDPGLVVRFFDYADALCRPLGVERVDDRLLQRLPRNRGRNYATMTTMFPNFCPVSAYR